MNREPSRLLIEAKIVSECEKVMDEVEPKLLSLHLRVHVGGFQISRPICRSQRLELRYNLTDKAHPNDTICVSRGQETAGITETNLVAAAIAIRWFANLGAIQRPDVVLVVV